MPPKIDKEALIKAVQNCIETWVESYAKEVRRIEKEALIWKRLELTVRQKVYMWFCVKQNQFEVFRKAVIANDVSSLPVIAPELFEINYYGVDYENEQMLRKFRKEQNAKCESLANKFRQTIKYWLIFDLRDDYILKAFAKVFAAGSLQAVKNFEKQCSQRLDPRLGVLDVTFPESRHRHEKPSLDYILTVLSNSSIQFSNERWKSQFGGMFAQFYKAVEQRNRNRHAGFDYFEEPDVEVKPGPSRIDLMLGAEEFLEKPMSTKARYAEQLKRLQAKPLNLNDEWVEIVQKHIRKEQELENEKEEEKVRVRAIEMLIMKYDEREGLEQLVINRMKDFQAGIEMDAMLASRECQKQRERDSKLFEQMFAQFDHEWRRSSLSRQERLDLATEFIDLRKDHYRDFSDQCPQKSIVDPYWPFALIDAVGVDKLKISVVSQLCMLNSMVWDPRFEQLESAFLSFFLYQDGAFAYDMLCGDLATENSVMYMSD